MSQSAVGAPLDKDPLVPSVNLGPDAPRMTISAPADKDLVITDVNLDGTGPGTGSTSPDKDLFVPDLNLGGASTAPQPGRTSIYAALCVRDQPPARSCPPRTRLNICL